ncbi:hypothetical protein ZHAS_00002394 [Anopheles sinensis]|uniref:Uncharacterized protein n=1 Tax=Anopheles sinensis TaxID=74873 RepID=A0A084VC62_ANOSI|nr:hypothetical protein ZHAS_00002394 [Anopheles sinensis]
MKFAIVLLALFAVACIEARPHPAEENSAVAEASAESTEENDAAVKAEAKASAEVKIDQADIDELVKELENNPEGRRLKLGKVLGAIAKVAIGAVLSG